MSRERGKPLLVVMDLADVAALSGCHLVSVQGVEPLSKLHKNHPGAPHPMSTMPSYTPLF
jgi:hypothetical protein